MNNLFYKQIRILILNNILQNFEDHILFQHCLSIPVLLLNRIIRDTIDITVSFTILPFEKINSSQRYDVPRVIR